MPTYLFWGEDDFAISQAIEQLKQKVIDPNWSQFNYQKISGDSADSVNEALNQAMTPVFGTGGRLVWLSEATVFQSCSEALLVELQRTLPVIPPDTHLLFTTSKKADGRLKSTKLLQKHADIREFSLIPPWKSEAIGRRVQQFSQTIGVKLTREAKELLADAVGNNSRQLWNELEKLKIYGDTTHQPIEASVVARLVVANTQNSLQLANAIRQGNQNQALQLVTDLLNRNEPALRIVATLVGQFRTWTQVKLMIDQGERDDKKIAAVAEVRNFKRIYFLRQEVKSLSVQQLLATLPILLELEVALKQGCEALATLQTQVVKLCQVCH